MNFIDIPTFEVKYEDINDFNGSISNEINFDYPHLSSIYEFLLKGNNPKPRTTFDNEYKLLSLDFFRASVNILHYVDNYKSYGEVIDNCSLPMLFTIRHAIELILKAAILKQNKNAKSTQEIFQKNDHNIKELYAVLSTKPENNEWLSKYLENIMLEDSSESLFRYSMDSTFRKKYHSIDSIRTTIISYYAYDSIIKFYFGDYVLGEEETKTCLDIVESHSPNGEYLIVPSDNTESMYTWQTNDRDLFKQITGFRDAGKVLFECKKNNIEALELPTLYLLRHCLEISLKTIITEMHSYIKNQLKEPGVNDIPEKAYNTHEFKEIWKYGKRIIKFFVDLYNWDFAKLDEIEKAILYIHNIDKYAAYFRYPTNLGLDYHNHNNIDFDKAYETFSTLIELMENMDYCVSDINDNVNELLSAEKDWY